LTALSTPQAPPLLVYTLPGNWVPIGIPRSAAEVAEASAALTERYPELAVSPLAVARTFEDLARACAALNVLDAHATVVGTPGGPLPVMLVASASPLGTGTITDLAGDLIHSDGRDSPRVRLIDLPAGRAVRAEWLRKQDAAAPGRLTVQYLVEIAAGRAVCVLTFTTPAARPSSEMCQVFHQIAGSVRCGPPAGPGGAGRGASR